jgi:hypothetical protein
MEWRDCILKTRRIANAIAWCFSLAFLACFLFLAVRAAIFPLVTSFFELFIMPAVRAIRKDQILAVQGFAALILAAASIRFLTLWVNRPKRPHDPP